MDWVKENKGAILSIWLIVFTIAIFGPLELYITNKGEFWFSLKTAITITLILIVMCTGILSTIIFIARAKCRELFGAITFAVGVALYIQGNYANINYGTLDGKEIDWGAYPIYAVFDTLGWLLLVVGLLFLFFKKKRVFDAIQCYGSLFIIGIQILTLGFLFLTVDLSNDKPKHFLSTEGMYELSKDENIIVFVLDSFDDTYFQELYKKNPQRYETVFEDFTYFDNATTEAARTMVALPSILSGEVYPGGISYSEYIETSFNQDEMYSVLKQEDYDVRIFTDTIYVPAGSEMLVDNQELSGYTVSSYHGLTAKYFELTLYKYMPHILKKYFWLYTNDFAQYKTGVSAEVYNIDDGKFVENMQIQLMEDKNAFRLYHLTGAHGPYYLDENAVMQSEPTSLEQQAEGVLFIVERYLAQMKEMGIYDNSTIIVMADHGDINEQYKIKNDAHGILFVKRRNEDSEFSISSHPVSYAELHGTIFSELGRKGYLTFFDVDGKSAQERLFYKYTTKAGALVLEEYYVGEKISSQSPLLPTGKTLTPEISGQDYIFGTPLTFGVDSTALPYIVSGISGTDEGNYTWTVGKEVLFQFPLESLPEKDISILINTVSVFVGNGPQEVIVSVNDEVCFQQFVDKSGTITIKVPKEIACKSEIMTLKLYLPDAISPLELYGDAAYDSRELSLAIKELCIEEIEEECMQEVEEIPLLSLEDGVVVCDKTNNELGKYLRTGFAAPEAHHIWTEECYASIVCRIEEPITEDIVCTINVFQVFNDVQQVTISCGDTILFSDTINQNLSQISFSIPKECLKDNILSLQLELPDAVSPKELGDGEDGRKLALAITSIELAKVTDE